MRKLTLVTPLLASLALGCSSKPPVGPGVVTITETTSTTTTVPVPPSTTIPDPTVADFEFSPQTPQVLQVVNFDGSVSKPGTDRRIVAFNWDFGDGLQKTGVKTTHDYEVSGVYLVTLIVTDDAGKTARVSKPVTVRPVIP
jgi:PKD repeat protein